MSLKKEMDRLKSKEFEELTYTDISDTYIYYIRVGFDTVGIKFCIDETEIA